MRVDRRLLAIRACQCASSEPGAAECPLNLAEHGCKWRGLPRRFENWHSIYVCMNGWAKQGVLDQGFAKLPQKQILQLNIEAFSWDSTSVKVHPAGTGALHKRTAGHRKVARQMEHQNSSVCRACSNGNNFQLVAGEAHDTLVGRQVRLELAS